MAHLKDKDSVNTVFSGFRDLTISKRSSEADAEYIIEGYAAVWDTIDTYNSRFQRGCFDKTIKNRRNKVKVLWNHDTEQPIGKLLDIREDDKGLFIQAQLIKGVAKAEETFNLIRGGAIDCFSFGFRTVKDKPENGIQVITEVALGEISPVVFEANASATIDNYRSTDFKATKAMREIREGGYQLQSALDITLDDIWWELHPDGILEAVTSAVTDFQVAYIQWAQTFIDTFYTGEERATPYDNELRSAVNQFLSDNNSSVDEVAKTTTLTVEQVQQLRKGRTLTGDVDLSELGSAVSKAYKKKRNERVEELATELRASLSPTEAVRMKALIDRSLQGKKTMDDDIDPLDALEQFRTTLTTETN